MINAWSLLYNEIYGDDEMSPCKTDHVEDNTVFTVGSGNTVSAQFEADNNTDVPYALDALTLEYATHARR